MGGRVSRGVAILAAVLVAVGLGAPVFAQKKLAGTQNFNNALKQYSVSVVPSGVNMVVKGEVLEFVVIETNT
jgi:hypothetical protein